MALIRPKHIFLFVDIHIWEKESEKALIYRSLYLLLVGQ